MFTLENDRIHAEISETGAQLRRLTLDGADMLWSGDEKVWKDVSPVLFPICGSMKNNRYTYNGKEYFMPKHGFISGCEFALETRGNNFLTLIASDTEETLKMYPFHFNFRVTYSLRGTALEVTYETENLSDSAMYFSVGAHEGFLCPEGIEDYDIIFEKNENLEAHKLDLEKGGLLAHGTYTVLKDSRVLPLYEKYFENDALVFSDVKSNSAVLRNRKTGRSVCIEFPESKYLLLWTLPPNPYICIEAWGGCPSGVDDDPAIEKKDGMSKLQKGCRLSQTHTVYF